jgi:hypothetical protein
MKKVDEDDRDRIFGRRRAGRPLSSRRGLRRRDLRAVASGQAGKQYKNAESTRSGHSPHTSAYESRYIISCADNVAGPASPDALDPANRCTNSAS